jgi:hypothetical membrane protein
MDLILQVKSFVSKYPLAGPIIWLFNIQYFIVQVVVASVWKPPYSWRLNAISDLGATTCGQFDARSVCSPLHGLMNASFLLLGILIYQALQKSRSGFALMAIAGLGTLIVGLFPETTIYGAHITGADIAFLFSNIALLFFGCSLRLPRWLCYYTLVSGLVALVAMYLFVAHLRFFLGLGGMERVAGYPSTLWLIVMGCYLSTRRDRTQDE